MKQVYKQKTHHKHFSNKELVCLKNINKYFELIKNSSIEILFCKRKIEEFTITFKEINFDIEVIEDPISRPLGTGQENKRLEIFIRGLESKVKKLQSKIHDNQCQIIKHQILIDKYESKIRLEQNNLSNFIREIRRKIELKIYNGECRNNVNQT